MPCHTILYPCVFGETDSAAKMTTEQSLLLDQVTKVTSCINIGLAALGLLGNAVCSRMMLTSPVKHISSSLFFFSVSLSDAVVVIFQLMTDIKRQMGSSNDILYGGNAWRCRFGSFSQESCRIASSWFLVAMMAELYLVTRRPVKAKIIYQRKRSCLVSIYIVLVAFAGTLPVLVITSADKARCTSSYSIFLQFYLSVIIRPCIVFICPFIILTFCLVKVFKALTSSSHSVIEQQASGSYRDDQDLEEALKGGFQARNGILTVTVLFFVAGMPAMVMDIIEAIQTYNLVNLSYYHFNMAKTIVSSLLLTNYCLKFYLIIAVENNFKPAMSFVSKCGLFMYNRSSEPHKQYQLHNSAVAANGNYSRSTRAGNSLVNRTSMVINGHSEPHTTSNNGLAHRF